MLLQDGHVMSVANASCKGYLCLALHFKFAQSKTNSLGFQHNYLITGFLKMDTIKEHKIFLYSN